MNLTTESAAFVLSDQLSSRSVNKVVISDSVAVFSLTCSGLHALAGGRCAGSSLMRRAIPPDYVPHVRVHSGEKNFHLVRRTHTYFIPHSDPPAPAPRKCVSYLTEKTKEKNNQRYLHVCSKMNTSFQQRETRLPASRRVGSESRGGIMMRDGGRTVSGAPSPHA